MPCLTNQSNLLVAVNQETLWNQMGIEHGVLLCAGSAAPEPQTMVAANSSRVALATEPGTTAAGLAAGAAAAGAGASGIVPATDNVTHWSSLLAIRLISQ